MSAFDWAAAIIIVISMIYLSFVLTLGDWIAALRKGKAVTLLPERKGGTWPLWTQLGVVLLGLALCVPFFYYLWIPLVTVSPDTKRVLAVSGLLIYLAGITFLLWARRALGRNWGISTSLQVKLLDDHQLIQSGPYALVRHPMYFGWWVALLGLTLLYPVLAVLLMLIFSIISFLGRARREEAALAKRFGDAWL